VIVCVSVIVLVEHLNDAARILPVTVVAPDTSIIPVLGWFTGGMETILVCSVPFKKPNQSDSPKFAPLSASLNRNLAQLSAYTFE
jgi:hypothetical protein